ncbi:MAG: hypothetical protein ACLU0O_03345 [Collinsella sp.]
MVSADESRVLFERLGGSSTGALSQVSRDLATSRALRFTWVLPPRRRRRLCVRVWRLPMC